MNEIEKVKQLVLGAVDHPVLENYLLDQFRMSVSTDEIIALLKRHSDSALEDKTFYNRVSSAIEKDNREKIAA